MRGGSSQGQACSPGRCDSVEKPQFKMLLFGVFFVLCFLMTPELAKSAGLDIQVGRGLPCLSPPAEIASELLGLSSGDLNSGLHTSFTH